MLRGLVVGLLTANLLFWAWTQGWLTNLVGIDPRGDHEPQRLAAQIDPQAIRVLQPGSVAVAVPKPMCLEAGPYTPAEAPKVEAAARTALPEGAWTLVRREKPGSWIIYTGRYASRESQQRKADELKRLNVAFEELHGVPELEPGFVFGRYNLREDAQEAAKRLSAQRVRTARVVQLVAPSVTQAIRIPKADAALQATAAALKPQLAGKTFSACRE
jgi:hypothetical protein